MTFKALDQAIPAAMNWADYPLWEFAVSHCRFTSPYVEMDYSSIQKQFATH